MPTRKAKEIEKRLGHGKYKYGGQFKQDLGDRKYAIDLKEVEAEYQELSGKMNYDGSVYLPRIIKKAFTLEQARVGLELFVKNDELAKLAGVTEEEVNKDVQKYQVIAIAKKMKLSEDTVASHIKRMFELGWAVPTRRGWRWDRNMMQAKDSMNLTDAQCEELGDEYFDLWEAYQLVEAYPTYYMQGRVARMGNQIPVFRTVPARRALEMSGIPYEDIVPEDNLKELLKHYSLVAVEHCPCKRLKRTRACQSPSEVCIVMDRIAEHNLKRGTARVIDIEEALAIHDMATEHGCYCNLESNQKVPSGTRSMICHCHWCCCDQLKPSVMMGVPLQDSVAASCYRAVVDPEKCTSCQTCLTRCQFDAIQMRVYPGERGAMSEKMKSWTDPDLCRGCGLCVTTCPAGARKLEQVKTGEDIPEETAIGGYGRVPPYNAGFHMDMGEVTMRPLDIIRKVRPTGIAPPPPKLPDKSTSEVP